MQAPPIPLASLRGGPRGLSPPLVQDGYRDEGGWARWGRKVMSQTLSGEESPFHLAG